MPRLIRFHKTGGPEVLQYDDMPAQALQPGGIRLKVEAIGLDRAEVMFREGQYVETPELPSLLGYEAAGVIEEVAADVTGFAPGDRAASIPAFSMTHYGALITACAERLERAKALILEHLESGALKPKIARVFPFDQVVQAHRCMESNEQIGQIVISVP